MSIIHQIMKSVRPRGYLQNAFMATEALRHRMCNIIMCHQCHDVPQVQ